MFEKKSSEDSVKKNVKVKGEKKSVLKIVLVPLLITAVLVAAIYLIMDKISDKAVVTGSCVVLTGDIRGNVFVTPDEVDQYFEVRQLDACAISEGAVTDIETLKQKGFYTNVDMKTGRILYDTDIRKSDKKLDKYKSGFEVTGLAVSNFDKGVNGKLREGAVIDVYAKDPETDELVLYTKDVYVKAAFDSSGNELTSDEGVAQSFTVYVKASEIESLNKAINYGDIHIYQK